MGWKSKRGHNYYYRSIRKGDQVDCRYVGGGLLGAFASILDDEAREEAREERQLRQLADRDAIATMEARDRLMRAYSGAVEVIASEAIEAAGYHRHNRGEWRRSRG